MNTKEEIHPPALAWLLEQGYQKEKADHIYWWALTDDFLEECKQREIEVSTDASEEARVRLYVEMLDPEYKNLKQLAKEQPVSGVLGNVMIITVFAIVFFITLSVVL